MAVDYKAGWDGHDARQKCGIITGARRWRARRLMVAGFLFARDFPEMEARAEAMRASAGSMGMSYELADAHVADMRAQIWTLTRATFTGAAILLREKAAYRSTSFRLCRTERAGRSAGAGGRGGWSTGTSGAKQRLAFARTRLPPCGNCLCVGWGSGRTFG